MKKIFFLTTAFLFEQHCGSESGYVLDGEKSTVRLRMGSNLSFIMPKGISGKNSSLQADPTMKAIFTASACALHQ